MAQIARNLTAAADGFLHGMHHILLDRDPLYIAAFRRLLRDSGVTPVVLPPWSPNLNAFAERFVESAKPECVDRMVPLGKGHLRAAVRDLSTIITKDDHIRVWATRSSRQRQRSSARAS
jgi:transposase InsO family protein